MQYLCTCAVSLHGSMMVYAHTACDWVSLHVSVWVVMMMVLIVMGV